MYKKALIAIIMLAVTMTLTACSGHWSDREYLPDITVQLAEETGEIVIKEWRWGLGSGAEIYYQKDGKQTLLGKTAGGDNGYCPFAAGEYTLTTEGSDLVIRWAFRGNTPETEWKETRFALPV